MRKKKGKRKRREKKTIIKRDGGGVNFIRQSRLDGWEMTRGGGGGGWEWGGLLNNFT